MDISKWQEYVSKPISVRAIRFTGTNFEECAAFSKKGEIIRKADDDEVMVKTNHGVTTVVIGDYIIKSDSGEVYPCNSETFRAKYKLSASAE